MNRICYLADVNWLSVIVATVVAYIIGALWYSLIFARRWQSEVKLSNEDISRSNMAMIFGGTFILNFIAAILLDLFIGKDSTLVSGMFLGLIVSIGWIATSLGINYLFSRKSLVLFLIDAGYFVVFFTVIGAILGIWN